VLREPIIERLKAFADVVDVCPEVQIGLGVPRAPIRLVSSLHGPRLLQPETGRDVTDEMDEFARGFLDSLGPCDGAVLKAGSPSCGLRDVRLYVSAERGSAHAKTMGAFGGRISETRPSWAIEDEGRLRSFDLRQHFLTRLFANARLRAVVASRRMSELVAFQAHHKLLLMAYHQTEMRALGRLVANEGRRPFVDVAADYVLRFSHALSRPPRRTSAINVLEHAFGYVSDHLAAREKAFFLETLADYRAERLPLAAPLRLMQSLMVRFDVAYLADQVLFEPFPEALVEVLDSGKGRDVR
jgi:uncharacterized protein YbgA (DUF1722 family)/uncharacterized protein YbbK (DUF523 family)